MAEMKQIHEFAAKWCDKFRDQNINYIELVDHYMADDCAALGFEMDCGHSLYTAATACGHSYLFRSIMGSGDIRALESRAEKREGLNAVMLHLTGRAWEMPDAALDGVEVFAIRADSWTGKHNQM